MTSSLKNPGKRRWYLIVGVCFLLVFIFSKEIGQITQIDLLEKLNAADLSVGAIFFILALSTLISEDLTCITAGTLAAEGRISVATAVAACAFGIFAGDILLFWVGRLLGRKALRINLISSLFSTNAVKQAAFWLEKYGMAAVLLSRFTPGLRLPLYLIAGILKTDFLKFTLYFLLATIIWTPIIVGIPAFFGKTILQSALFADNFWLGFFVLVVGFYIILRIALQFATWKGRRLLLGRFKRFYKWEFWPLKVFYLPVVLFILWLGFRFRSLTVFTVANPAIPAGGFVGESKQQILQGLVSDLSEPFMLLFTLIENTLSIEEKLSKAEGFLSDNSLDFPIAIKPDAGERGSDVHIVSSAENMAEIIESSEYDLILQEFASGPEVSVFYYRYPNEEEGKIFSITEKRFPEVVGDGESTIEDLILKDSRAICLAQKYFDANQERLFDVPKKGEVTTLVEVGTHSRGAVFLDGGWLKTEALAQTIDQICRQYKGFYFGRFDIRTDSLDDFQKGANFKIIELNGVTSEATNIYDPRYSLVDAYRILFGQWKIAFEIGSQNREKGFSPVSIREMVALIANHLRRGGEGETRRLGEEETRRRGDTGTRGHGESCN